MVGSLLSPLLCCESSILDADGHRHGCHGESTSQNKDLLSSEKLFRGIFVCLSNLEFSNRITISLNEQQSFEHSIDDSYQKFSKIVSECDE